MRALFLSLVLLLSVGCASDRIRLVDDADLEEPTFFAGAVDQQLDQLHLPYMLGAQVRLSVRDEDGGPMPGFRIEILDDGVLRMDVQEDGVATVTAIGEGATRVRLIDEEARVFERAIDVRAPDELRVVPHREQLVGSDRAVDGVTVLAGTTARFDVQAFADGERLHGLHALAIAPNEAVRVHAELSPEGALSLTGLITGTTTLELLAGTEQVATLEASVVDESVIERIEIVMPDEEHAAPGAQLYASAICVTRDGTPIEGPEPTWTSDVVAGRAVGDVLAYSFDRDATTEVSVSFAGHVDRAAIHATAAEVFSSDAVRCSAVPGARGSAVVLLGVLGVAFASRRRGRHATKRTRGLFPAL